MIEPCDFERIAIEEAPQARQIIVGVHAVLIDHGDVDRVTSLNWHVIWSPTAQTHYVCHRSYIKGRAQPRVWLHRFIMGTDCQVDHKDHNGLNNRRSNLRLATKADNARNTRKPRHARGCTSKFKGVSLDGSSWRAIIRAGGKPISLGSFADEVEAARAYDSAAIKLHGEFAYLNLPRAK